MTTATVQPALAHVVYYQPLKYSQKVKQGAVQAAYFEDVGCKPREAREDPLSPADLASCMDFFLGWRGCGGGTGSMGNIGG